MAEGGRSVGFFVDTAFVGRGRETVEGEENLRGIKPAGAPFGPPGSPKGGGGRPPIFERIR